MYINKVKEFHESFDHPINDFKNPIDLKTRQLRVKLLFEELEELATASDVKGTFGELCLGVVESLSNNIENDVDVIDGDNVDKKEEIDALCDIQYVLSGAVLALGYQDVFDDAFEEVQRSNMSKMCRNLDEVEKTKEYYEERGFESHFVEKGDSFIVLRKGDNKVLKNINYSEADLEQFIR